LKKTVPTTTPPASAAADAPAGPRFVSVKQMAEMFAVHPRTIGAWVKAKRLPPPLRVSDRKQRWDLQQVLAWVGRGAA
jgi:predicted DNA-binding transcriptional regulator AlpA